MATSLKTPHGLRRAGLLLFLSIALAGCRTWQTAEGAPGPAIAAARPDAVRLVRSDGTRLSVSEPTLRSDSIVGFDGFDLVGAPLADVRSVELQRWSVPRTAGFLVAQASLVLHVFALIVQVQPHYRGLF
ncbi:MAG: hypothetical protein AB7T31_00910 [Gemmatimonadales bacterium]